MYNIKKLDSKMIDKAFHHIDSLTKPPKSLGILEELAAKLYMIYNGKMPEKLNKRIYIFAGDHGIAKTGVSAFPPEVTSQMVLNFINGGAAINVFARHIGADVKVVDAGVNYSFTNTNNLINMKVGYGTKDIRSNKAMSIEECTKCIENGIQLADDAVKDGINILIGGEMGIGNTTSASALFCKYLNITPEKVVGPGTGINAKKIHFKIEVVKEALKFHHNIDNPIEILASLGGYEIAHLTGLIIGTAKNEIPYVVDGFIATSAAVAAINIEPNVSDYLIFGHNSAEPFYKDILNKLEQKPILDLNLRLGEGTGAALALPIIEAALKMFNEMATFKSAGVSEKCND